MSAPFVARLLVDTARSLRAAPRPLAAWHRLEAVAEGGRNGTAAPTRAHLELLHLGGLACAGISRLRLLLHLGQQLAQQPLVLFPEVYQLQRNYAAESSLLWAPFQHSRLEVPIAVTPVHPSAQAGASVRRWLFIRQADRSSVEIHDLHHHHHTGTRLSQLTPALAEALPA